MHKIVGSTVLSWSSAFVRGARTIREDQRENRRVAIIFNYAT